MRMPIRAAFALLAASLCAPLAAQSPLAGKQIVAPAGSIPSAAIYCDDGTGHAALCSFGGGGGGGGGGDASATNQATQIAAEWAIRDRIGDVTSPTTGSSNYWLAQVYAKLATPVLASGAATSTNQDTTNTRIGAPNEAACAVTDTTAASLICLDKALIARVNVLIALMGTAPAQDRVIQPVSGPVTDIQLRAAPLTIGGNSPIKGGSFTRPADTTQYAIGDLVANSTTAGSVVPGTIAAARINGGTGVVTGIRLSKTSTSLTNATFRVHLFKGATSSPYVTTTVGDNGVFAAAVNGVAAIEIGYVDVTVDQQFSDGAKGSNAPARNLLGFEANTATTNIYYLIEARAAYTPTSGETFTVALEESQD